MAPLRVTFIHPEGYFCWLKPFYCTFLSFYCTFAYLKNAALWALSNLFTHKSQSKCGW